MWSPGELGGWGLETPSEGWLQKKERQRAREEEPSESSLTWLEAGLLDTGSDVIPVTLTALLTFCAPSGLDAWQWKWAEPFNCSVTESGGGPERRIPAPSDLSSSKGSGGPSELQVMVTS